MKNDKYILEIEGVEKKRYKKFQDIVDDYDFLTYTRTRMLYMESMKEKSGEPLKRITAKNKKLFEKMKIYDIEDEFE